MKKNIVLLSKIYHFLMLFCRIGTSFGLEPLQRLKGRAQLLDVNQGAAGQTFQRHNATPPEI